MLRLAVGLGVPPMAFWALSLKEWRMLTAEPDRLGPMRREAFERLAEAWPDD
jgi:hypothetical protein